MTTQSSGNWWDDVPSLNDAAAPLTAPDPYFEPPSSNPVPPVEPSPVAGGNWWDNVPSLSSTPAAPVADPQAVPPDVTGAGGNWWDEKPGLPPAATNFEEPSSPERPPATEIASSPLAEKATGGGGSELPLKPDGTVDYAALVKPVAGTQQAAESAVPVNDGSREFTLEDGQKQADAKGAFTVGEGLSKLKPGEENVLLKALGIATGSIVAGAAAGGIWGVAGTVAAGTAGAAVALPYVLAAAAILGVGALGSWAGKTLAEKFSTEDEEKSSLLAAQIRQTTGKYTPEELAAGIKETDRRMVTIAKNEALVESLRQKGWWATATDVTVDMLPFVAEFASLAGSSNRIASFVLNPRKAARVYEAASAIVDASKAPGGTAIKFESALAQVMGGIAKAADKGGRIALSQIDEYAGAIANRSGGKITQEVAADFLRNFKKPGLLERHLTEVLGATLQTGASVTTINRREFEESKLRWAGKESDGTQKAFLDSVVENWSERMGGLLFDPMLGKVFGGAAVKYGAQVPRAIEKLGNGFKYISQKLRVDSPIGEYWEESIGGLVRSALDLNDDGKTSKQTRIFESLTSFVPHTEEQAKMLFSFGVSGIFGAATASAMGAETDMERAVRENSLSIILPHLESAHSGPTAVLAVDQKQERVLARAFVDALVKSKDEDKRNFVIQKLADVLSLSDQFRYKKGSVAQIYEGIRGSEKGTTIESVLAEVERLKTVYRSKGEEAAMDWVVKNITGRTTNVILEQHGQAPLTFNLDEAEAKALNELYQQGEITPRHSSNPELRGLDFTPTGKELTDVQKAIIAEHARVIDPKGATAAESAANQQLMLKTTVPLKMNANVPRKSTFKQLLQHVTRSGNYQQAGVKATEQTINTALDLVDSFSKTRNPKAKAGIKGVEVHLAPLAISQNIRGHEELGRGAIYGTNYIDPKTGIAHIFVAAEAETPDIVEEVVELAMKEKGSNAAEVQTVLQSLQLDYGERVEKKLDELEKNQQLSEDDLKGVKAIRAMIQAIGQTRERSAAGYEGKDKLNDQQVTEFASSFVTALLSMNNIGTKSAADLMSGRYFGKRNQAGVFVKAFHAMRQLSDVGPELMVSAADAVNQLIDVNQLDKNSLSAYKRFAEAAGKNTASSAAQRRFNESRERRQAEQKPTAKPVATKPVESKPAEKPVTKPVESKPVEKPAEPAPVETPRERTIRKALERSQRNQTPPEKTVEKPSGKPAEKPVEKPAAPTSAADIQAIHDDIAGGISLNFSARALTRDQVNYRLRVAGVSYSRVILDRIMTGKYRVSYILKNADVLFSEESLIPVLRGLVKLPPETVLDDATIADAIYAVRAPLGLDERGGVSLKRQYRLLLKQAIVRETAPREMLDVQSDNSIFNALANQLQASTDDSELDETSGEESQVGQEAMDEESLRAAMGVNDAVKALGFSSEFDRVKLWEMLSPFSDHPESKEFRAAVIAAISGTQEEYEQFLAAGYAKDSFIDEFLRRLSLNNLKEPNQSGLLHLFVAMNSTYIPLAGHGVFHETKKGVKAVRIADTKSRIAGSLVRTFKGRFVAITKSPTLLLDTLYYYIQAFNEAKFAKGARVDEISLEQLGRNLQTSPYQRAYQFMETLIGVDARELFAVDVQYKKDNPDKAFPTLAAFYIEMREVVQAGVNGRPLVGWNRGRISEKTGAWEWEIDSKRTEQTLDFNPEMVKQEILAVNKGGSVALDQYVWLDGALKNHKALSRALRQQFNISVKAGGRSSKSHKVPGDGKRLRDTSNLHEIAQGLAKTGRHISIKKAKGGVVFNAISTSHLTSVAFENGWDLGRVMTISRSEGGTVSASFGSAEEAVDVEEFLWSDVAQIMQGEFDSTPEGQMYRAWLAPFSEKKDVYTISRLKMPEAQAREEYARRLAALFFDKPAKDVTAEDLQNFADPKDYNALPNAHSLRQFFAHPSSPALKTSYDVHHALNILDSMVAIHSDKFTEDYKNSEEAVKRRGSDVASGYSMVKEMYVARTGRDYIAAATIVDPQLHALVGKILGRDPKTVDAADGLALSVNEFMDVAEALYGPGITKVGQKGQPTKLNMIKSIVAGPREIFKQSLHRLPTYFSPEDRGMLYQIAQLVERHNKLGEPLDMVVFSSAAKKKGQTAQAVFDTRNPNEVKLLPDVASNQAFTFENITRFPVEQFKWQLNLQKPPKLKLSVVPRQPTAVAAQNHNTRDKHAAAVMEQILGTEEALKLGFKVPEGTDPKDFKGFTLDQMISATSSPMLDVAVETGEPDAFGLLDYTEQMAKAVRKALQFRIPLTQAVEVPLGQSTADVRDFVGRKKNGIGEWVDTLNLNEEGVRMAYAHVQVNVEAQEGGLRYNEVQKDVHKGWAASKAIGMLSDIVRKDWVKYLDMFEHPELIKTAEDAANKDNLVREWEFFKSKAGWVIPGEPMLIARIPADNMYSTTVVRAGEKYIVNEAEQDTYELPNLIRTPLSLQVAAGSDFDADKRFILPFVGRGAKRKSLGSGWNSVLASMMQDFDSPANYKLFMEPLDTGLLNGAITQVKEQAASLLAITPAEMEALAKSDPKRYQLAKAVQESLGESALQLGTVEGALALYRSNQVGKRGLGQAAALLYGFNLMESVGVRLQQEIEKTSFKGFTFTNPFTGKPATIVAGRTGGEGLGNYVTTTKRLFGTFLNLFADHGKLQKITKLGIDDSNIHIVMSLMFAHGDFVSLDAELDYLVNTVVPFLYTAEALEAQQDNQKLNSVALPMSAKSKIWDKESEVDAEGRPVSRFEQVEVMARSFQKMNQILRNMFKDSTINISDYEALNGAVDTLQGVNRGENPLPGQYGAWTLGGIPSIFKPSLRGLSILKQHVYNGSLRESPAWQEVKAALFSAPIPQENDPKGTSYDPIAMESKGNLEILHDEMHNAVALLSMTGHLQKLAGLKTSSNPSMALRELAAQTVDQLVAEGSEFADNLFFEYVTSGVAERFVIEPQPRSSTGARTPAKNLRNPENPIMQIGVSQIFRSSPISDAEIERIRADFNKLPEQAKAVLTLYALYRYGATEYRSFQGSYIQFISKEYRKSIHEATADRFKALLTQPWTEQQMSWFTGYVQDKLRRGPKDFGVNDPLRKNLLFPLPLKAGVTQAASTALPAAPAINPLEQRIADLEARLAQLATPKVEAPAAVETPAAVTAPVETPAAPAVEAPDISHAARQYANLPNEIPEDVTTLLTRLLRIPHRAAGNSEKRIRDIQDAQQILAGWMRFPTEDKLQNLDRAASAVDVLTNYQSGDEFKAAMLRFGEPFEVRDPQHSARRYVMSTATPVSIKQAISWAAKEKSDASGLHIKVTQGKLDKLREKIEDIESDENLNIKGRENAIVAAASPYYREFPALRGFVTRLFRDAPGREERYLENRLSGAEPGYIGNPDHRKPYREEMLESFNPKAAAEVKAMLDDKPYPNMQDSSIRLSHSARYSAAAEAIFNDLPDVYGNKDAKEILKLATRAGRWGATNSAIASQKIRRKLGARLLGYADTGKARHKLADRVLEALTVLIEDHGDVFASWNRETSAEIEAKLLEIAKQKDLRILRNSTTDLMENPDESEDAPAFIPSETAEKVADVLQEYMNSAQSKKHSFAEVGKDVVDTMETLRQFANASVGYAWIAPFRYGQHNYMIHQYSYPESASPEDRERWQSEETGRIIERDEQHKTYTEAALNFGHMPKTLNAAELIEGWGTSVNQIMQNKILLTGLSRIKDRYGNAMVVPARVLGAQEGNVRGSVIPELEAEDTLRSLVGAAEQYSAAYRKDFTWHRDPVDSVWDALNKLTQHLAGNQDQYNTSLLNALGYEKVTVKRTFGLQNQDFYVVKGAPLQAVRHLVEANFEELATDGDKFRYKLMNGLLKINRMIKSVNVSFSLFQHFALIESWLADAGPLGVIQLMKNVLTARKVYTDMMENGETAAKWIQHGLQLSVVPYDVDLNLIDKMISGMGKSFDKVGLTFVGNRVRTMLNLKKGFDNFLWHQLTPLMKIQVAEAALKGVAKTNPLVVDIPVKDMTPEQRKATYEARDDIAKYVNDSLGSQEWSQFLWATPHVRDLMNTFMFSPDWTLSALNISGVPEVIGKAMDKKWLGYESFTDFGMKHRLTHYIPGFFAWVFIAWPFVIQAAIAAAFGGGGGDGDDDEVNFIPLMNEEGQKFSADITPLIRHYQRKRGVPEELLSREKTYLQPGKQMREVFQWFADPVRTGFSKAAPPIRMAVSAITGVVSPSISLDKTWASKNEADKWSKIAAGVFPFSVTALTRQDDLGGPIGGLLTSTLPRNSGKTRFVQQADLVGIYRDFIKGKGVRTQNPEQAFDILQSRIAEQRENYLGKLGSGSETLWDTANKGALSSIRTTLNSQLKAEYAKPDADRDAAKIQRLLYAVLLTHKSTKETYQFLESSFKSALKTQESVRNPEKVERLTSRENLRQMRQDLYEVSGKNNVRPYKLK